MFAIELRLARPSVNFGNVLVALLIVTVAMLQYRLWFGSGSLVEVHIARQALAAEQLETQVLKERNAALDAEVADLKHGSAALEERARYELGMIRRDETFYQIIDK